MLIGQKSTVFLFSKPSALNRRCSKKVLTMLLRCLYFWKKQTKLCLVLTRARHKGFVWQTSTFTNFPYRAWWKQYNFVISSGWYYSKLPSELSKKYQYSSLPNIRPGHLIIFEENPHRVTLIWTGWVANLILAKFSLSL